MNILFVHQSADLYGSDKVLLSLVTGLDKNKYHPIVLLPKHGPLTDELEKNNVEYHILPLVLISRKLFSFNHIFRLPFLIRSSNKAIDGIVDAGNVNIVHSNTMAVLSGAFWARKHKIIHLWHIHEMITRPRWITGFLAWIVNYYSDSIVSNSLQTQALLQKCLPAIKKKSICIWNGIPAVNPLIGDKSYRQELGINEQDVLVVLAGRINWWKGQTLLVQAAEMLTERGFKNIQYLIIGSPPDSQEYHREALRKRISESSANENIFLKDFTADMWAVWDSADIAVVPSTEPEPFGLVAVEAMRQKKPVIAAAHGGLLEVVEHEKTGILFSPGDTQAFADSIQQLVRNPDQRIKMGKAGYERYKEKFSESRFLKEFERLYDHIIKADG